MLGLVEDDEENNNGPTASAPTKNTNNQRRVADPLAYVPPKQSTTTKARWGRQPDGTYVPPPAATTTNAQQTHERERLSFVNSNTANLANALRKGLRGSGGGGGLDNNNNSGMNVDDEVDVEMVHNHEDTTALLHKGQQESNQAFRTFSLHDNERSTHDGHKGSGNEEYPHIVDWNTQSIAQKAKWVQNRVQFNLNPINIKNTITSIPSTIQQHRETQRLAKEEKMKNRILAHQQILYNRNNNSIGDSNNDSNSLIRGSSNGNSNSNNNNVNNSDKLHQLFDKHFATGSAIRDFNEAMPVVVLPTNFHATRGQVIESNPEERLRQARLEQENKKRNRASSAAATDA